MKSKKTYSASVSQDLSDIQTIQDERKVTKSNELIRKGCYSLTTLQQKFLCYLISDVKPTDTADTVKEYDLGKLCDVLGIPNERGESIAEISNAFLAIASKRWWWNEPNGDRVLLGFINTARITADRKKIIVTFNTDILPYLQDLQQEFTTYRILFVLGLKSKYAIRLYELLKSAENCGQWRYEVNYLKRLLDCESYTFGNMRARVLDPALHEINEKSDISVSRYFKRDGKTVTHIDFMITPKDPKEKLTAEINIHDKLDNVLLKNSKNRYGDIKTP